jgi:hypothetical protein
MSTDEYVANWPQHCRKCGGIGGTKADSLQMPKECPECFGRGLCGRCAAKLPKYQATCPECGWRAFNAADALPGGQFI